MANPTSTPIPTVHLNGTPREQLQEQLRNAAGALMEARTALCEAAPHGRDYYPQGPEALQAAQDAHYGRLARLHDVIEELTTIYEGIL